MERGDSIVIGCAGKPSWWACRMAIRMRQKRREEQEKLEQQKRRAIMSSMEFGNLYEYLRALDLDSIKDDEKYMKVESEAILIYCKDRQFVLSDEDYREVCRRIDEGIYDDWEYEFKQDLGVSNDPWYEEAWYDEDLIDALRDEGVPVTSESLAKFRDEVREIFEDQSERNEMLRLAARQVFRED